MTEIHKHPWCPSVIIPDSDPANPQGADRWREALMASGRAQVLRLPEQAVAKPVKDVNELAQIERDEAIFADLVRRSLLQLRTCDTGGVMIEQEGGCDD